MRVSPDRTLVVPKRREIDYGPLCACAYGLVDIMELPLEE